MKMTQESLEAYLSQLPKRERDIFKIYEFLKANHGTRDDIRIGLNMNSGTVSARCADAIRGNIIKQTDQTKLTSSGRKAKILMAQTDKNLWDLAKALSHPERREAKHEIKRGHVVSFLRQLNIKCKKDGKIDFDAATELINKVIG